MALALAGDCILWKAPISGLALTTSDPEGAGWTRLTGTSDLGQDASNVLILEVCGRFRVKLDKNITAAGNSCQMVGQTGGTWQTFGNSETNNVKHTVTTIQKNTAQECIVGATFENNFGGVHTVTWRIKRGLPAAAVRLASKTGSDSNFGFASGGKTILLADSAGGHLASDIYGYSGFAGSATDNYFQLIPLPSVGAIKGVAVARDPSESPVFVSGTQIFTPRDKLPGGNPQTYVFFFLPGWTWGLGDGGGADVGNGDGQLREAEDNFTAGPGTWAKSTLPGGTSAGAALRDSAPAVNNYAEWDENFPVGGEYLIGAMCKTDDNGVTADVGIDGDESESGGAQSVVNNGFAVIAHQNVYGPFDVAAGDHTVRFTEDAVAAATIMDLDFIAKYPYASSANTPASQKLRFPKDVVDAMLREVSYA